MLIKFLKGRAAARVAAQKPAEASAVAQDSVASAVDVDRPHDDRDEAQASAMTDNTVATVATDKDADAVAACESQIDEVAVDADDAASSKACTHADWEIVTGQRYSEDRALYNRSRLVVEDCVFGNVADDSAAIEAAVGAGDIQATDVAASTHESNTDEHRAARELRAEAALRECSEIEVRGCSVAMPYVLWHCRGFEVRECEFAEEAEAPLWHNYRGQIEHCRFRSAKALRQCLDMSMSDCTVVGKEFGWKCSALSISKTSIASDYCLLDTKNLELKEVSITASSALQYVEDVFISKSTIISDDCLWNARKVTIHDAILSGERLGWYSDSLTLIDCTISSSQPLCYCKNLKLINCQFERADRAFEYSDVDASICGHIDSIFNPLSGRIRADSVGEIISDSTAFKSSCIITTSITSEDSQDTASQDQA